MPPPKDPIKREEWCRKISNANHGIKKPPRSEDHCRHLSEAGHGKHPSEITRKKLSETHRGEKSHLYGKHPSEKTRRKLSEARSGEKNPWFGKHLPEETRRKIGEGNLGEKNYLYGKHLTKETRKKMGDARRGENNGAWKGGISFKPYCPKFNDEFRERVRAFFGYRCVECSTPENGRKLDVHHVNYDKMVCCNDVKPLFVALCNSCNAKANSNRSYWEQYFTGMIMGYYEGECYFTEEEMEIYKLNYGANQ